MSQARAVQAALPIGLLAAAAFLSSSAARVIDSLLHVIATDFLVSVPQVAIVVAAFTLPYGLSQILLGPLGDRFGKLRVILGALLGSAAFNGACAFAPDLPWLVLLRACAGATSAGLIPVSMAYIADGVPYAQRQVVLSRFLTGVVVAQTLAGPLGGVFGQYVGWRGVFLVLSALAFAAAAALALRLRGLPDQRSEGRLFRLSSYAALIRHRTGRLVLLAAMVDGALLVGCFPFQAPYLHEAFGLPYAAVGLVLACFGLGAWIYIAYAKALLRRFGEAGLVLAGGVLMAGAIALAAVSQRWELFVPAQFLLGLGFFMLHSVLQARATEILPNARATAVATFAFMLFLGQSMGALLAGFGIGQVGYGATFLIQAGLILAMTAWITWLIRREQA